MTAINGMVASAGAYTPRFLAATNMLFLSRGEARDLQAALGVDDASGLLGHGPEMVVVTQGSAGSLWHTGAGTTHVPAVPAVTFVDSTGAGDAFVAGALFGVLAGLDGPRAGRCAAVVASFIVETWGCQTNLPSVEDLQQRYREHFNEELPV
jgi:sugar/nucleoside kinase (ribokinase family)